MWWVRKLWSFRQSCQRTLPSIWWPAQDCAGIITWPEVCKTSKQGNSSCNVCKIGQIHPSVGCNGTGSLGNYQEIPPQCFVQHGWALKQSGEEITGSTVAPQFLEGLVDLQGIQLDMTSSGSMTQEVLYYYAKHFVCSLPEYHGATICFLDGHASCWSVPALWYHLKNHFYAFFLASHTSIWSQPNDGGVNKWFHLVIKESCSAVWHGCNAAMI